MDRLYAPWRSEYLTSTHEKAQGCVFCSIDEAGDDRVRLLLHRGARAMVVMNRYPYNAGHLLVMPRAHLGRLDQLDAASFGELHALLVRAIQAVEQALEPHGINVGMNLGHAAGAGIPDHLHYHVVPRWTGDTNFMPVTGETKVISQDLLATYDLLKAQFV
ncbi:MAG: HIT domain-containing protein [Deltaproteobacteria bacterium]|nr:HIT domain-containing protein [Deltaproteobacteria bacterium]